MATNPASKLMARYYPQRHGDALDRLFCTHVQNGMFVLDAGCGAERGCSRDSRYEKVFIVGADRHVSVGENPYCDAGVVTTLPTLPFADDSFDMIHCRWVLEHVENPTALFREFARVLKRGGHLLALTPNLFHYATIGARITPFWFHRWWWGAQYDPFPTYHRANTARVLRRFCGETGLQIVQMDLVEREPTFLVKSKIAFLCGVLFERTVNLSHRLAFLRHCIVLHAINPG